MSSEAVIPSPVRTPLAVLALTMSTTLAVMFPLASLRTGRTLGMAQVPFYDTDMWPCRRRTPIYFWVCLLFWTLFLWFVWMLAVGFTLRLFA